MKIKTILFMLLSMLSLSVLTLSTRALAASLTVDSLADTKANDGYCTLREAIQNANNNAATNADCAAGSGADTITFSVSGTITLTSALPTLSDAAGLTIDGTGQTVTISGDDKLRVLYVGDTTTLINLTIADGYITGGTVGGGIYHCCDGILTITNCTFSGNRVDWQGEGGAIYNYFDPLIISHSTFTENTATAAGGAIFNSSAPMTITNSTFSGNRVTSGGAPTDGGGAIAHSGSDPLTIADSTFTGNSVAFSGGGGIKQRGDGTLTISNSTFYSNTASSGGGLYLIYNENDNSTIIKSTFSQNSADNSGGGIFNGSDALLSIANSTFYSNTASTDRGGGIFNNSATLTVTNSTLSGNNAGYGGGGIGNYLGTVTLRNTIIANSTAGGNCYSTITDGGHNLEDGTSCNWVSASGSISNTNPLLGAPTGAPAYLPLDEGSPAIGAGDDAICAAAPVNSQSQNGLTRPQDIHCDIGSYEAADNIPPAVQSITRLDPNPTQADSVDFLVTFREAVSGVDTGDFTLTVSGITGASITAINGGATTYTVTVNTGSSSGTIRLDGVDDDTILDQATNPLGGAGAGNGNFTDGETYAVRFPQTYLPLIIRDE